MCTTPHSAGSVSLFAIFLGDGVLILSAAFVSRCRLAYRGVASPLFAGIGVDVVE